MALDVLHHLEDPAGFFQEAQRCLKNHGSILMVEPYISRLSRFWYKVFHHELCDARRKDWTNTAPVNLALSWIILVRDKARFQELFPSLKIKNIRLHTIIIYLLSGGVKTSLSIPAFFFPYVLCFEKLLSPFLQDLATMMTVELEKEQVR